MKNKRSIFIILSLSLISTFLITGPVTGEETNPLFPIEVDGLWGFMDRGGNIVIEPQYSQVESFCDDLASVQIKQGTQRGKWGYIDKTGRMVVPPAIYFSGNEHHNFNSGLLVFMNSGNYGVLNTKGEYVCKPVFFDMEQFAEGFAAARMGRKWGYVDSKGIVILEGTFDVCYPFSNGMARGMIDAESYSKKPTWHYTNIKGEVFNVPGCEEACDFSEDLAAVKINNRWGFINKSGETVIEPKFREVSPFSEGFAAASVYASKETTFGYIDKKGNWAIDPIFTKALPYSEGLAQVFDGKKWGYIDKKGNLVIDYVFLGTSAFKEGMASVLNQRHWGFIDRSGEIVIETKYTHLDPFYNGLSRFKNKTKDDWVWGYIDKTGEIVWQRVDAERHINNS